MLNVICVQVELEEGERELVAVAVVVDEPLRAVP
jgi:hypothetical protein